MLTAGQVTKVVISPERPEVIRSFDPPGPNDLDDQPCFKYADYHKALKHCVPYVKSIAESVNLVGGYKYTLLDVKVIDLAEGQCPCLPGWHLDCTMNPHHPTRPETHHIFVSGAGSRTRFVVSPVELTLSKDRIVNADQEIREQAPEIYQIDECTLVKYSRSNLHAPSLAECEGRRLLIRVTETDLVRPNSIRHLELNL